MSRICARPGCDRPAVATLSYSYADGVVWVSDLAPEAHPMVHDLCGDHAELSVPRGWERRDRRVGRVEVARLWDDEVLAPAGAPRKTA